jgi:hypothetical protein
VSQATAPASGADLATKAVAALKAMGLDVYGRSWKRLERPREGRSARPLPAGLESRASTKEEPCRS